MKGLTRQQLDAALMVMGHSPRDGNDVIFEDTVKKLFGYYGDDYVLDLNVTGDSYVMAAENPVWDETRRVGGIKIRKGHKVPAGRR